MKKATGGTIKGKQHIEKGQNDAKALINWLKNNKTAKPGDIAAAENVLKDLLEALGDLAP